MKNLLIRFVIAVLFFSVGMHGMGFALRAAGMDYRGNPAWRVIHAFTEFEWAIVRFIGLMLLAILICTGLLIVVLHLSRASEAELEAKAVLEKKRQAEEQVRYLERCKAHDEKKKIEEQEDREIRNLEYRARKEAEMVRLNSRTPEQKERDAIEELTKGW